MVFPMTDKQINKWLRRQFSRIGWLLLLYYALMTVLTSLTAVTDAAKQHLWSFAAGDFRGQIDWDAINSNAWGYIAAMFVGFGILDAWKGRNFWKQEVLTKGSSMKPRTFACMLCFCMGAQMANSLWITLLELLMNPFGKSVMPILESVSGDSNTFSMFLYASLLAPIWEELLFRGYVLRTLRPYGKRFAVLMSAVFFGLFHGNLLQTPYALLMGLVLGYVTVEYSIGWAVLLHVFNNLVLADFLTRLTAGWSEMAYGTLNLVLFGGSALISLVILIKNRSGIRDYRGGEWMDRRCVRCFFTSPGVLVFALVMCVNIVTIFLL